MLKSFQPPVCNIIIDQQRNIYSTVLSVQIPFSILVGIYHFQVVKEIKPELRYRITSVWSTRCLQFSAQQ